MYRHSWAWDGFRKRIWHAGGSIIFHTTPLWETVPSSPNFNFSSACDWPHLFDSLSLFPPFILQNDVVTVYAHILDVSKVSFSFFGNFFCFLNLRIPFFHIQNKNKNSTTKAQDDEEGKKERLFARVEMGAWVNGIDLGLKSTVQLPIESEDDILFPGVSLVRAEAVSLNFGYHPFRYRPPPASFSFSFFFVLRSL